MRDYHGIAYRQVEDETARRAFAAIDYFLRDVSRGFGRIQNGQVPDSSGDSISNVIDLSDYLYLPGRRGGQTVRGLTGDLSPIVTLSAATAGAVLQRWSITGVPSIDMKTVANGSAIDYLLTTTAVGAGLQIQLNNTGSGLRFTNQAALSGLVRGFIEAGPTSESMALTGFNGSTGTSVHSLFNYGAFTTWDGIGLTSGTRIGINTDPYEYRSSAAASRPGSLIVARMTGATSGVPTVLIEGASSSQDALAIRAVSTGTAPSKAIDGSSLGGFRHDGQVILAARGLIGAQGLNGGTTVCTIVEQSSNANSLGTGLIQAWSDSLAQANSRYLCLGDLTSTHRAVLVASQGFGIFTRLGFSSAYTLISNAQGGSSGMLAPEATPTVLRVVNSSNNGADGSVLLKLQSNRAGQSGDFLQCITSTPTTVFNVSSTGVITATGGASLGAPNDAAVSVIVGTDGSGSGGGFTLDDGSGFFGRIGTVGITAARTWNFPDGSGTIVVAGVKVSLTGGPNSTFDTNTASSGAAFQDTTTTSKKLRFVLSGAVGNNSITLTNTAARNYGLGNLGGNVAIVGDQAPAVSAGRFGKIDLTAQSAAIGSTNLTSSAPTGMYIVQYELTTTTADATAGTLRLDVAVTGDGGAVTTSSATNLDLTTANAQIRGTMERYLASGEVAYAVALATGAVNAARFAVRIRVTYLG